jgi:thiol:disulfide interchange protein DsbC
MKSKYVLDRRSALLSSSVGSVALLLGSVGRANSENPTKQVAPDKLKEVVAALLGGAVDFIQPAPVPGWYEVISRGEVLYVDGTGRYLFQGHLVDIASRSSLTSQRKAAYEKASMPIMDIGKLNLTDAIKNVYGRELPGRFLVTFEDPRCGFCKRLHQTLLTLDDLVVYTFPLSFLGPESRRFNESIWCSGDRAEAWREVMQGIPPSLVDTRTCDFGALDRNGALADFYRVQGTPTLFNSKGSRIDGAASAQILNKALQDAAQPQ